MPEENIPRIELKIEYLNFLFASVAIVRGREREYVDNSYCVCVCECGGRDRLRCSYMQQCKHPTTDILSHSQLDWFYSEPLNVPFGITGWVKEETVNLRSSNRGWIFASFHSLPIFILTNSESHRAKAYWINSVLEVYVADTRTGWFCILLKIFVVHFDDVRNIHIYNKCYGY